MKRNELIEAIKRRAEGLGYIFYTGNEAVMAAKITEMPAFWLSAPRLKSTRGRSECRDTYEVKSRLFVAAPSAEWDDIVQAQYVLETDARALVGEIGGCEGVRGIGGVKITPETRSLTPRGEIGVALEFEAEMFYNKYN